MKLRAYFTVVKSLKPLLKPTWCDAFKRLSFMTVKFCDALFHSVTVFGQKFLMDYFEFKNNYDLQNWNDIFFRVFKLLLFVIL